MAVSYGAYGMVMTTCAAFNGIGYPLPALIISAIRTVILFLPMALLGKMWFGLNGIFVAAAVVNIAVGLLGFAWFGNRIRHVRESGV